MEDKIKKRMEIKNLRCLFYTLFIGLLLITISSAENIQDSLHLNFQFINASGSPQITIQTIMLNISTNSTCSDSLYNNISVITPDVVGRGDIYLNNITLNFTQQYYLHYIKNGLDQGCFKIARVPYTFNTQNVSWLGIIGKPTNLSQFTNDLNIFSNASFNQSLTDNLYLKNNTNINLGWFNLTSNYLFGLLNWNNLFNIPNIIYNVWGDYNDNNLLISNGTSVGYNSTIFNNSITNIAQGYNETAYINNQIYLNNASWSSVYNESYSVLNSTYGRFWYNMTILGNYNYNETSYLINTYGINWYNHTLTILTDYGKWFYNMSDGNSGNTINGTRLTIANITEFNYNYNQTYSGSIFNITYDTWLGNWTEYSKFWYNHTLAGDNRFINSNGDNMTGTLNINNNNITNIDRLFLTNGDRLLQIYHSITGTLGAVFNTNDWFTFQTDNIDRMKVSGQGNGIGLVDIYGNLTISGNVSAQIFSGDGSQLTNTPTYNSTYNTHINNLTLHNETYHYNMTELNHSKLINLQGGLENQYYHLNFSLYDYLINNLYNFINGNNVVYNNKSQVFSQSQNFTQGLNSEGNIDIYTD